MSVATDMLVDAIAETPRGGRLPAMLPDGPVPPESERARHARDLAEGGTFAVDGEWFVVLPVRHTYETVPQVLQAIADAALARIMLDVVGAKGDSFEERLAWARDHILKETP